MPAAGLFIQQPGQTNWKHHNVTMFSLWLIFHSQWGRKAELQNPCCGNNPAKSLWVLGKLPNIIYFPMFIIHMGICHVYCPSCFTYVPNMLPYTHINSVSYWICTRFYHVSLCFGYGCRHIFVACIYCIHLIQSKYFNSIMHPTLNFLSRFQGVPKQTKWILYTDASSLFSCIKMTS